MLEESPLGNNFIVTEAKGREPVRLGTGPDSLFENRHLSVVLAKAGSRVALGRAGGGRTNICREVRENQGIWERHYFDLKCPLGFSIFNKHFCILNSPEVLSGSSFCVAVLILL